MTKEEYLQITSYQSIEEAKKDLTAIRILFPVTLVIFLFANFLIGLGAAFHDLLGLAVLFGLLVYLGFFIWKCREIIQKTKKVSKAQLLFSIILAPLSWIWFYPQLSEPLEIIVGSRMPPTTDITAEGQARVEARKKGSSNAIRTILIVAGIVFLFVVATLLYQQFTS